MKKLLYWGLYSIALGASITILISGYVEDQMEAEERLEKIEMQLEKLIEAQESQTRVSNRQSENIAILNMRLGGS